MTGVQTCALPIYPNPAKNKFTVSIPQLTTGTIEIFNPIGEKVYSTAIIGKQQTINNKLPSGIYFVKVTDREKQFVEKLIVQ